MSDETTSVPISARRLRLVYLAGIALNLIALVTVATSGQWLLAVTFGFVIAYLAVRYRMLPSS